MKSKTVILITLFMLVSCKPSPVSSPIPTAQPSPEVIASPTRTNTVPPKKKTPPPTKTATMTPTPTATPTLIADSMIPAPAGLVYQTGAGLWQVKEEGKPDLIYPQTQDDRIFLSPYNYIFYVEYLKEDRFGMNQYVIDLSTHNKIQVYPRDNLNLCPFTWMPGNPDILYTVLLPEGADPGYSCERGSPVFLSLDGNSIIFLDEEGSGWSSPDVSSDGQYVAYDKDGKPWLYEWGKTAYPFNTASYGISQTETTYFSNPSWSPDDSQLAWTTYSDTKQQHYITIFDLKSKTYSTLNPCRANSNDPCDGLARYEASQPYIDWSSDGKYLSILNCGYRFFGIFSLDGKHERMLEEPLFNLKWNPIGPWYARITKSESCQAVFVESADGQESHRVGCGEDLIWSPDGKELIFGNEGYGWLLVDVETWSVKQIDVPPDSVITDWINLSVQ